ncbi:MAG: sensor histidine kinase [Gaiellaceae bacterium]
MLSAQRIRRSDVLVPAVLALFGAVEIAAGGHGPLLLAIGTYWLAAGVLVARRAAPIAVPLLVGAIYALAALLGSEVAEPTSWVLLLPFACFGAGHHTPRSRRLAGLASVLGTLAITYAALAWLTDFDPSLLFGLIFSVGPWALGVALREALDRNRRLAADAERARLGKALAAQRAEEAERNRIAGELHDVLAHTLAAMVVQASVASDLVRRDAERAAGTLRDIAQAGRDALAETGRLLRLLRDDHDELGLRLRTPPEPDPLRTPAPAVVAARTIDPKDVLLPVLFGAVGTVEVVSHGYGTLWASIGAYWLAVGVLCARRVVPLAMPLAVTGIAVGARLLGAETDAPASWVLVEGLSCFAAGFYVLRARAPLGLVSVLSLVALLAADAAVRGDITWDSLFLAFAVGPWAVGVALRETLERNAQLAAEAERARLEQELEADRAAGAERRRIARELHDVLANSLSVMIVQASLAADLVSPDPMRAARAVGEVKKSGRTALDEIGRLLRLIRNGGEELGTHPQHGVADIPALADEYARAGLGIELELDGVISPLPIGVELSTYRIVQEALTNVLKHAPGSPVRVYLARHGSNVAIEVRNGPAASAALAGVPGGHGLVGLRERVTVFGGDIDAGPTLDGGFVVTATLPVGAEAA